MGPLYIEVVLNSEVIVKPLYQGHIGTLETVLYTYRGSPNLEVSLSEVTLFRTHSDEEAVLGGGIEEFLLLAPTSSATPPQGSNGLD